MLSLPDVLRMAMDPSTLAPPCLQPGRVWERIVDTSRAAPDDALLEGGEPITCVGRGQADVGGLAMRPSA